MQNKPSRITLIVTCVALLAPGCGFQRAMERAIQTAMKDSLQTGFGAPPLTIYVGGSPNPQLAASVPIPFLPLAAGYEKQRPRETMSLIEFGLIRLALPIPRPQKWHFEVTLEGCLKIL